MQEHDNKEQGFTLIELLVAIVVVGILTAVAIVGIGGLTNKGNNAACSTSVDAARGGVGRVLRQHRHLRATSTR